MPINLSVKVNSCCVIVEEDALMNDGLWGKLIVEGDHDSGVSVFSDLEGTSP